VASRVHEVGGGELMRPRRLDAAINKRLHHIWIGPLRPVHSASAARGEIGDMPQWVVPTGTGAVDRARKQLAAEIKLRSRHVRPSSHL